MLIWVRLPAVVARYWKMRMMRISMVVKRGIGRVAMIKMKARRKLIEKICQIQRLKRSGIRVVIRSILALKARLDVTIR